MPLILRGQQQPRVSLPIALLLLRRRLLPVRLLTWRPACGACSTCC